MQTIRMQDLSRHEEEVEDLRFAIQHGQKMHVNMMKERRKKFDALKAKLQALQEKEAQMKVNEIVFDEKNECNIFDFAPIHFSLCRLENLKAKEAAIKRLQQLTNEYRLRAADQLEFIIGVQVIGDCGVEKWKSHLCRRSTLLLLSLRCAAP